MKDVVFFQLLLMVCGYLLRFIQFKRMDYGFVVTYELCLHNVRRLCF